jgi:hypothetical protein
MHVGDRKLAVEQLRRHSIAAAPHIAGIAQLDHAQLQTFHSATVSQIAKRLKLRRRVSAEAAREGVRLTHSAGLGVEVTGGERHGIVLQETKWPCERDGEGRYWYPHRVSSDEVRTYAWNWFAMHAGQRLQLVNFWLVAVAFLATAFVQSQISHVRPIAAGVALIGAVASLAFQRLDARTRQLSQVAEDALRGFEDEWVAQGANELIALVKRSRDVRKSWADSYRIIIQGLQLCVALVFVAAFIYALAS